MSINELQNLSFLQYNNCTKIKKIKAKILKDNVLFFTVDKSELATNKIMSFYWKYSTINVGDITHINLKFRDRDRIIDHETRFFTSMANFQHFSNFELTENNILSYIISIWPSKIYEPNIIIWCDKIVVTAYLRNEYKLEGEIDVEIIIQHPIEPDNLSHDTKKIDISLYANPFIFTNLPFNLEKIVISKEQHKDIEKYFPKIPFGCLVEIK